MKNHLFLTQPLNIFHPMKDSKSLSFSKSLSPFRNFTDILFIFTSHLFSSNLYTTLLLSIPFFFSLFPGTPRILIPGGYDFLVYCVV